MKTKTLFKQTEIGEIPEDWEVKTTDDLFYIKGRIGWRGLKKSHFTSEGPYLITGVDFKNGKIDWEHCFHIPSDKFLESPEIIVQKDDILLTKDGTIGKVAYIDEIPGGKASINAHILLIRNLENNLVYSKYMYYVLQSNHFLDYAIRSQTGTTRAGLPQRMFEKFTIPLPPYDEQKKIAEVLSTSDDTIHQSDIIIEKSNILKKGITYQLFTRGINHSKFKQTEIGDIPDEWNVKRVIDLFEIKTGTTPSTKISSYWDEGGIIWITPADMSKLNGKMYIKDSKRKVTEKALHETNLSLLPTNSILLSTRAPVGYVSILENPAVFNQGCKGLIPKSEAVDSLFYAYFISSKNDYLQSISSGSTFKELSKNSLISLLLPSLPIKEQQKIASIISELDHKIDLETKRKEKLEQIKKSLTNDLLTGKKRLN